MKLDQANLILNEINDNSLDAECEVISSIVEYSCKQHEIEMFYMENSISEKIDEARSTLGNDLPGRGLPKDSSDLEKITDLPTDVKPVKLIQRILDWGSRMLSKIKILINVTIMKNCFNKLMGMIDQDGYLIINIGKIKKDSIKSTASLKVPDEISRYVASDKFRKNCKNVIDSVFDESSATFKAATYIGNKINDADGLDFTKLDINEITKTIDIMAVLAEIVQLISDPSIFASKAKSLLEASLKDLDDTSQTIGSFVNAFPSYNWRVNYQQEEKKFEQALNNLETSIKAGSSSAIDQTAKSAKIKYTKSMNMVLTIPTAKTVSGDKVNLKTKFGTQFILHTVIMHLDDALKIIAKDQLKWKGALDGSSDKDITDDELKKYHQFVKANYTHYVHLMTIVFKKLAEFTKKLATFANSLTKAINVSKQTSMKNLLDNVNVLKSLGDEIQQSTSTDK